jgi:hypothetical protein
MWQWSSCLIFRMFGVQMPFSQSKNCFAQIYQHGAVLWSFSNHQYVLLNYQNQRTVNSVYFMKIRIKDPCWFWVLQNLGTITRIHEEPAKKKVVFYEVIRILHKFWEPCLHTRTKCLISLVPQLYIRTRNLAFENHVYQRCKPPPYPVAGFGAVSTKPSSTITYLQIHNYYQNTVLKLY